MRSSAVRRERGFPRGFTLVEALVAIAIIATLVAILAPSLRGARNAARRAECMSRLKQLGVGLQLYMDHGDRLLPFADRPADASMDWLSPFDVIGSELGVEMPRTDGEGGYVPASPFACPSDGTHARTGGFSYEYLPMPEMALEIRNQPRLVVTRRYELLPEAVVLKDAMQWHDPRWNRTNGTVPPRSDAYNALRFDGSVARGLD